MAGSLRLSLVDTQLKHFKLSLQALAKIGTDLLIEALPTRLILRCINPSRSAYLSLTFHASCFDAYDVFRSEVVQAGVLMKQVLAVFRTQRINRLNLDLGSDGDWLEVVIFCDSGLRKTFRMRTTEAEILQASVDRAGFPITLTAETQSLARLLASFQWGLEELTLVAVPSSASDPNGAVQLHSHADPSRDNGQGALVTKLAIDARRTFLEYQHTTDGVRSVTFNVKDFKAMLSLCEHLGRPLVLRMEGPGLPLMAEPGGEGGGELEAQLVLATLMEGNDGLTQATGGAPAPTQPEVHTDGPSQETENRISTARWDAPDADLSGAHGEEQEVGGSPLREEYVGGLPGVMTDHEWA
uniref:Cell cycle checkpoint control protein RAD9A n=1 Tax=Auxenochlorella protothecoides TaxID=3075 RepID=A0A1D2A638_AUXPR